MALPKQQCIAVTDIPPAPYRLYFWSGSDDSTRRELGIRFPYEDYATLEEAREAAALDAEAVEIINMDSGEVFETLSVVEGVDMRLGV